MSLTRNLKLLDLADVHFEIIRDKHGSAHVIVHSPMYVEKVWEVINSYGPEFSDYEIACDVSAVLVHRYNL